MPIESLKLAKAPNGWNPNKDQVQQIQSDPRLQQMTRDDLYFFFNQPKQNATPRKVPMGKQPAQPQQTGATGFGWIDAIITALQGARR